MKSIMFLCMAVSMAVHEAKADRDDVAFPETVVIQNQEMVLKGTSLFKVGYVIKVYVAALYQPENKGPDDVLKDQSRRLELYYFRDIDKKDFIKAGDDVMAKLNSPEEIEAIRDGIDQINRLYQSVKKGDRYALTYIPGTGTILQFNGSDVGVIPGSEFARVYFSIWLGEKSPHKEFRDRLVGLK